MRYTVNTTGTETDIQSANCSDSVTVI